MDRLGRETSNSNDLSRKETIRERTGIIDLRHLRYVVATAWNGNFSAASPELKVQQPIVSR